jgi:MYXO-CTERM domain-containing protein
MFLSRRLTGLVVACLLTAGATQAQVVLAPLDPVAVDTTYASENGDDQGIIQFVNDQSYAIDLFWIDYAGNRVKYGTLDSGMGLTQYTYLTHPWLAVEAGTGTTDQGTGHLIAGFLAQTANPMYDLMLADRADINAVPEPSTWALALVGLAAIGRTARRKQVA